ncbi:MAG TPA: histidine phosphatase family protein [Thermoleophilaceae bacterium]
MIYLARHGRTPYNHEGRFQGHGDVPLDDLGRAQAAELAELAAGQEFAALWASPLARARETAGIVAARIGLPVREDLRLAETHAGDWTDRLFADVDSEDPDGFRAFVRGEPTFAFPGGESFAAQGDRVMAALAEIERGPLPALVVCHGMTIRLALARRRGEPGPGERLIDNGMLVPLDDR